MKAFLIFVVVWFSVETLARVFLVALFPYPRKIGKGSDAVNIVINFAVLLWAVVLLERA